MRIHMRDEDDRNEAQIDRAAYMNHPVNIDAEYAVIGGVYLNNDVFAEILERIKSPEDFDNSNNRAIFRAMAALYERGEPIDYVTVAEELRQSNTIEDAGGIANATDGRYLNLCIESWRAINYAEIVAAHARKRRALAAHHRITAKIFDSSVTAEQALALIEQEFQPLADEFAENTRQSGEIVSAAELMRMEIPETRWPISGVLPEGLAIIGAPPKTGKSALALQIGLALAMGGKPLGNSTAVQGDVLYLALEDSHARMKERIERQLCGEAAPENLDIRLRALPMLEGGLMQIESWLRTHPDAQAVIIDTIGRFRGFGSQTENGNAFVADYQDMAKLQSLALKHHVAIVALHHLRKDRTTTSDPLEALSGTAGMSAPADAVWVLSRDRNQELGELQIIGRDVQEQNIAVKLSSLTLTWQVIGAAEDVALKEGQRKVFEALRSLAQASTPTDIANFTGESLGTVKTRLVRMKADGLLTSVIDKGRSTGKYWFGRQRPNGF